MSGFEINLYSNKQEYHRFSTEDFALLEIGIGNYNLSSIANFFKVKEDTLQQIKPMNPDVKEFFTNNSASTLINKLIGEDYAGTMKIMEFDIDEKKYKEVVSFTEIKKINQNKYKVKDFTPPAAANIKEFLKKWNEIQRGFETDTKVINGYKVVAYKIQNSLSGCITFDATLPILNTQRKSLIKFYLLENADAKSSREMSFKGSPFMTNVPSTAYGAQYSFRDYQGSPTAAYGKPAEGDVDNPKNTVSGKMRTVYDPSTGEFESGTQQMLARLLEDIDSADVPTLTVDELKALSRSEIYDDGPDAAGYMGNFTKGKAVPLSAENGNPHMFGPDFQGGCTGDKKVQITVINRLNQSYKAGALVVVSRMLGESGNWIIVSPGTDMGSKKKMSFGNFEYGKWLIPDWNFFIFNTQDNNGNALSRKLTPENIAQYIRNYYYSNETDTSLYNDDPYVEVIRTFTPIQKMNLVTDLIDSDGDISSQMIELDNKNQIDRSIENNQKLGLHTFNYGTPFQHYVADEILEDDQYNTRQILFPRNISRRSSRLYNLSTPYSTKSGDEELGVADVPGFWGILFPEGFRADQCAKISKKPKIANNVILGKGIDSIPGDPNLSELSLEAGYCVPNLGDTISSLLFASATPNADILTPKPKYIRKTGVYRSSFIGIFGGLSDPDTWARLFHNYVTCIEGGSNSSARISPFWEIPNADSESSSDVALLEPVNPAKLQFSPLSIEQLYAGSDLKNPDFLRLKTSLDYFKENPWSTKLGDSTLLHYFNTAAGTAIANGKDIGNLYYNPREPKLSFNKVFYDSTLPLHSPPIGVLRNGIPIIPTPANSSSSRSPCIPVLTCKSSIVTNADSLVFTVNQHFGSVAKQVVTGGQPGSLVILPIGGVGVALQTPDNPLQKINTPQWGDSTRSDSYDSLGTTALHIRIFEQWPINQTIYLGPVFTPLHLNPSASDYKYEIEYPENEEPRLKLKLDSDNKPIENRSEVDFQLPTKKDGSVCPLGSTVTKEELKPISEWKWTKVRRSKLLTKGGFIYLKPVFAINNISLKKGGKGYKQDTLFTYPDGTSFKINVDNDGKITGIKDLNYGRTILFSLLFFVLKKDEYSGILSLEGIQPTVSEGGGSGAEFDLSFSTVAKICMDKCPKEVVPITRLTKPSNNGDDSVDGISTTSVDISGSSAKKFDIFYFFHNDPTHYSLDATHPYYRDIAQYVISEVKPG
jgi:hypothetical protein